MMATAKPAGATSEQKTKFYVLDQFYLKNGTQPVRINEFMSKAYLPVVSKVHAGPRICMEALVATHMPQFALITGYRSLEELASLHVTLVQQEEFLKAFQSWESDAEPPYEHCTSSLLEAAEYSPEIVPLEPPPSRRAYLSCAPIIPPPGGNYGRSTSGSAVRKSRFSTAPACIRFFTPP